MKMGDLIKWIDHKGTVPMEHVGLFIKKQKLVVDGVTGEWGDILVLCDGQYVKWTSWQCEVISEGR
tara:strand:- start:2382 stop:2579 length:198 start_codon:yes stop_codon:yes gene_type:complete